MPYIKQTIYAGKTVEVHKYYSSRYGKRTSPNRRPHTDPTPEDVAEVNRQHAVRKIRGLVNANFCGGDLHVVFSYRRDNRPEKEEAKRNLKKLMRDLKKTYAKEGIVFKYICVTEYENTAIHHHIVLKKIDVNLLRKAWPHGKVLITVLDDSGQYGKLAAYLIKETDKTAKKGGLYKKRWNASQNLDKPVIVREIIQAKKWRTEPKIPKGFYLWKDDTMELNSVDCYTQLPKQDYILVRLE